MYDELLQALQLTGIPVAEGDWDRAPQAGSYIAVRLDDEPSALWGDGRKRQQALGGSVHLFARSNDKSDMLLVQHILGLYETSWRLASVQHEARNHIVHYEWTFELEGL